MPLIPAKCTECGANINIDSEKKLGVCEYCGQPFVVQEAIQNFNTSYNITNNNNISAKVVNVYDNKSSDFIIKAGELVEYNGSSQNVLVPDSVSSIGFRVFLESRITSICLPKSVKYIGERAFEWCTCLKKVVIESDTIETGLNIFQHCDSLEEIIHKDNTFTNIESWENYCKSGYRDVDICFSMTKYKDGFPNDVKRITALGANASINPIHTEVMIIPDSVEVIETRAFLYQTFIKRIELPSGLRSIGEWAFNGCTSLEEITIPGSVKAISNSAFLGCNNLKTVVIEEGVEYISSSAFGGCVNLEKVVLPSSIKSIGEAAFSGDSYYDIAPLRKLSTIIGPEQIIDANIEAFDASSPFIKKRRRLANKCQYCGGEFKGFFSKVCIRCGRKKDY